jgi:hypothetical protein
VVQLPTAVQIQRNARRSRPRVPDTQLAIFWTVRRSNQSGFAPLGAGRNAGVADRSEHVPHFRDRLVRSDAGRRILTGDGEGALAGMRVGEVLHPSGCIHCDGA